MFERVSEYVDKLLSEKKLPLLDVMVYKDHQPLYRHYGAYGRKSDGKETLAMFSCTKVFTSVSAMRLVEEGKIALDAPVSDYIPAFKAAYTVDDKGNKHPEVITVRHLFTMSSGFDYKITTPEIVKLAREKYDSAGTLDIICALLEKPLNFKPGEKFLYSLSHDALGAVIEAVSGMSIGEYMKTYIFDPLGMNNSTMYSGDYLKNPPLNHDIVEGGFAREKGNQYRHLHPTKNYFSGGAGLIGNVEDLAIFADTLASGGVSRDGYRLIGRETIEMMKRPHFDSINVKNHYTCVQGTDYAYGLGVRVRTVPLECGIPVGEFGWDGAAGSYLLIDTDHSISVTMGMNVLNWPEVFRGEHLAIAKLIYEELL